MDIGESNSACCLVNLAPPPAGSGAKTKVLEQFCPDNLKHHSDMSIIEDIENWTKTKTNIGYYNCEPVADEYVAKYSQINVTMEGDWKMVYTYGMVWMKELSTTLDISYRLESLAIVYAMLKACDRHLITLDSWGPKFCCPSGHELQTLMKKIIGDDDEEAIEWFTANVVETGRRILTGNSTKPKLSIEDRISAAVEGTFWRLDEGMFRAALVLHVWLRCGEKMSLDDPAIILTSANAAMTHDALSVLRTTDETQDKSEATVLDVNRAVYGQTILFCIKMADIAMSNVCDSNVIWTVLSNFILTHMFLNVTLEMYGVGERMLASEKTSLPANGVCLPDIDKTVIEYYCAVIRKASEGKDSLGPWIGRIKGGSDWLNATTVAVMNTAMHPGRPAQIMSSVFGQSLRFRTAIGLELLDVTKGKGVHMSHYYACFFPKHYDCRFIEAVTVLFVKLEAGARKRDAGPPIADLLITIPDYLIEKAFDDIARITFSNEHRMHLLKESYAQAVALRSSAALRDIAKTAFEQHQNTDPNISDNYRKYIDLRLLDGYWRFTSMLYLIYENGKLEDIDSPGLVKMFEASIIFLEEGSNTRRKLDDDGFGYWSCLGSDERKSRAFGRNRAKMLWRQGRDEMSTNGTNYFYTLLAISPFQHNYNGLPGTAPWLSFQELLNN